MIKNLNNSIAGPVPLRYRLSSLKALYQKFLAASSLSCFYETFTRNVPFYITRPKPDDWGTCLCPMCLNPELKLEALAKHVSESSYTHRNGIEVRDKFTESKNQRD